MHLGRIVAVALVAFLLVLEVARLTVASRVASDNPDFALRLAPQGPEALSSIGMAEIGEAAARGADPSPITLGRFRTIAEIAPLRPEPFLVEAALAERAGDLMRAHLLLLQARQRDPRSIAGLYLLADVSLRRNRVMEALENLAILSRLVPGASVQLIPSLAAFAQSPGAEQQLARVLSANPNLKRPLLDTLSADARNTKLVLALAGSESRSLDDESKIWKARLVNAIISRGDYGRAYQVWRNFADISGHTSPLLFNGDFRRTPAAPPFDWTYTSSSAGLAEPSGGTLRVLYYGREDSVLASQLLLLRPGSYRFEAPAAGSAVTGALTWRLTCRSSGQPVMNLPVAGLQVAQFEVPRECEAQILTLNGIGLDAPQVSDVQIGPVRLERSGA